MKTESKVNLEKIYCSGYYKPRKPKTVAAKVFFLHFWSKISIFFSVINFCIIISFYMLAYISNLI